MNEPNQTLSSSIIAPIYAALGFRDISILTCDNHSTQYHVVKSPESTGKMCKKEMAPTVSDDTTLIKHKEWARLNASDSRRY